MCARFRFGIFELDLTTGKIFKKGVPLRLQPQSLKILSMLLNAPGEIITREEIRQALWRDEIVVDYELGINRCIRQIRQVLSDDPVAPRYLETLPRQGYRFIAPVERLTDPSLAGELGPIVNVKASASASTPECLMPYRIPVRRALTAWKVALVSLLCAAIAVAWRLSIRGSRSSLTPKTEAYNNYLRGRFEFDKRTPQSMQKSIDYFRIAIQQDPHSALAYAGLAKTYVLMSDFNLLSPHEAYSRGEQAASEALQLDPTLSDAHAALAIIRMNQDWDWSAAEEGLKRALALSPGNAITHQWYSFLLSCTGRHSQAIDQAEIAQRLDPLSLAIGTQVGSAFYWARRYDAAIQQLQQVIRLEPSYPWAHFRLGLAYAQKRQFPNAIEEFRSCPEMLFRNANYIVGYANVCAMAGSKVEAERMLSRLSLLSSRRYVSPSDLALAYISLAQNQKALHLLNQAYLERDDGLDLIKVEPMYDPLRQNPQFQNLLRQVGLGPN